MLPRPRRPLRLIKSEAFCFNSVKFVPRFVSGRCRDFAARRHSRPRLGAASAHGIPWDGGLPNARRKRGNLRPDGNHPDGPEAVFSAHHLVQSSELARCFAHHDFPL